jgi:hypothetical protein
VQNTYFRCKKLFFSLGWVDCRPEIASLSVVT